jgi:hypothetical protein
MCFVVRKTNSKPDRVILTTLYLAGVTSGVTETLLTFLDS